MKTGAITTALSAALLSSACSWVEVDEEAKSVTVVKPVHVEHCEKLSETRVKVANSIGPIQRGDEKIAKELEALGKNEAKAQGGDTIVPLDKPDQGRQSFGLYRCE